MVKRRKKRKSKNAILSGLRDVREGAIGLTTASLATTIGADVITKAGAGGGAASQAAAAAGSGAMVSMAGFYPAMGTMVAGGGVLKMMGGLQAPKKYKRKKRR